MTATAELDNYGFPQGYFIIRSVAMNRLLDVKMDESEDGTEVLLFPQREQSLVESFRIPESNNQVFFTSTEGALCSRSSGHAIDVENEGLVLRHRRPVSYPYPNHYSHPVPQFRYSEKTGEITITFEADPAYPDPPSSSNNVWRTKSYNLTAMPMRKPRSFMDDASEVLSSALRSPLSLFSPGAQSEQKLNEEFNLREDELEERDRGEDAEVDDSPEDVRKVKVIGFTEEDVKELGDKARIRRMWEVVPLRTSARKQGGK